MSPGPDEPDCAEEGGIPHGPTGRRLPRELFDADRHLAGARLEARRQVERLWDAVAREMTRRVWIPALLLIALPTGAGAQLTLPAGHAGWTACATGLPVNASAPMLDSLTSLAVARHEAVHRAQLAGDCDAVLHRRAADPAARLEAEAEAYCAELEVLAPRRPARSRTWIQLADRLAAAVAELQDLAPAALARWCAP